MQPANLIAASILASACVIAAAYALVHRHGTIIESSGVALIDNWTGEIEACQYHDFNRLDCHSLTITHDR